MTAEAEPFELVGGQVGSAEEGDAAIARVIATGGTVVKPGQRAALGGNHSYVADLDGFRSEIVHNRGCGVDPEGRVHIEPIET